MNLWKKSVAITAVYVALVSVVILFGLFRLNLAPDTAFNAGPGGAPTPLKMKSIAFWHHTQIWDTHFFLDVSTNGYTAKTAAFFPLYPALTRITTFITHDYFLGAALLSILCVLVSVYYFLRLAELYLPKERRTDALLLFLFFPTSFFLAAPYTESLFVPLLLAALYYTEIRRWWFAALFGFLLALTRVQGISFFLIPAYFFLTHRISRKEYSLQASILAPIAGLSLFGFFLWHRFGNFFQFVAAQKNWHRDIGFTANSILHRFSGDWRDFLSAPSWFHPKAIMYSIDMLFFVGALLLAIIIFFRWRRDYALFCLALIGIPALTGTLYSMPRFVLPLAPIFALFLARQIANDDTRRFLSIAFALAWTLFLIAFANFYWVA